MSLTTKWVLSSMHCNVFVIHDSLYRIQSLIGASPRTVLMKATSVCPQSAELHFLAAKMELSNITKDMSAPSSHGMSASSSHVMSASSSHGMSASSSHGMSVPSRHCDVTSAMQRAVGWLEKCVKAFYKIPSDVQDSELSIETVLLYRYTFLLFCTPRLHVFLSVYNTSCIYKVLNTGS